MDVSAVEGDDIDQLNDETFGTDIMGGGDWEEEHEKLSEEVEVTKMVDVEQFSGAYGDQNAMEYNISQLVEDGEDGELDDPAIMAMKRTVPMPMAARSHRGAIRTSSPPAFVDTLDNLLHPDSDIWGSPSKHSPENQQFQKLLKQSLDSSRRGGQDQWGSSMLPAGAGGTSQKSSEVKGSSNVSSRLIIGPPRTMPIAHRPRTSANGRGNSDWLGPPPGFGPPALANVPSMPIGHMRPQLLIGQPVQMHQSRIPGVGPPTRQVPMNLSLNAGNMPFQLQHMPIQGAVAPGHYAHWQQVGPADSGSRGMGPPQLGRPLHPAAVTVASRAFPNHSYVPLVLVPPPGPFHTDATIARPQSSASNASVAPEGSHADGCIMTKSEKDWIIKIQMLQLHTDDPFIDDYYFTMHSQKKRELQARNQRAAGGSDSQVQLIIPAIARIEVKEYKPVQFEGSLGRLTLSSIHKPKQVLDVSGGSHDDGKHALHRNQRYREALMHIEQSFNELLEAEDMMKKIFSVPDDRRPEMLKARETIINHLYDRVSSPEHTLTYLSIRKGKVLLGRLLQMVAKAKAQKVVYVLLRHFSKVLRKDVTDNMLPGLLHIISFIVMQSDLHDLLTFSEAVAEHLQSSLQNQFFSSIVTSMLVRAEDIYSGEDVDVGGSSKWGAFVKTWAPLVVRGLAAAPLTDKEGLSAVLAHVARFVDAPEVELLRKPLALWLPAT